MRDRTAHGGHGMWLVNALADRWGSDKDNGGKHVWFELDRQLGQPAGG